MKGDSHSQEKNTTLKQVAGLFLKLGIIGFGGPAAHISMMQQEVVQKRKWFSEQHFLDLVGATNLIPGPNSTELAIHIGHEKAGWKGLIVAGMCFIFPAVCITGMFAWLYKAYGHLPEVKPFIYGIQPAIIAVVLGAIFPMAKKSLKSLELLLVGTAVLALALFGVSELVLLFGAGIVGIAVYSAKNRSNQQLNASFLPLVFLKFGGNWLLTSINGKLFVSFLKIGSILYGSGYVLFAFLDAELVETGMLSHQSLTDAIAVGQFTPGPVFSAVTFVGYQINGLSGAVVSTIGIFLPSFVFVAILNPLVKKLRNAPLFSSFLDAVNVASVALIVAICCSMGKDAIADWRTSAIALLGIVVVFGFKRINSAWVVLGGSLVGYLLFLI